MTIPLLRNDKLWLYIEGAETEELVLKPLPPIRFVGFPQPQEITGLPDKAWEFKDEQVWMVNLKRMVGPDMAFLAAQLRVRLDRVIITILPQAGLQLTEHELTVIWPYLRQETRMLQKWLIP